MRLRYWTAALLSVSVVLAACERSENVDSARIERQLRDNEAKWQQAYGSRDVGTIANAYAEDAALANPGAPLITEPAARRQAISEFVSDPNFKLQFAADRVQVAASGDLAYTRGHFTVQSTDPESKKPHTDNGNYLTVWQKQGDGGWRAIEDFVTPGPPSGASK